MAKNASLVSVTRADLDRPNSRYRTGYFEQKLVCDKCQLEARIDHACIDFKLTSCCSQCMRILSDRVLQYSKVGKKDCKVTKLTSAFYCSSCRVYYLDDTSVKSVDSLADIVTDDMTILSELGISSERSMEVFCSFDPGVYDFIAMPTLTRKASNGISVRFGNQSPLFKKAIEHTTIHDTEDFGHKYSTTFRITPGPPYTPEQKRTITLLISQIQAESAGRLRFWTVNLGTAIVSDTPKIYHDLIEQFQEWDESCVTIALLNEVHSGEGPGSFLSLFRLLEFVLHKRLVEEIQEKRFDASFQPHEFEKLTSQFQMDLKTRLKMRLESLPNQPIPILRSIWQKIDNNGAEFRREEVYDKLIKFRNKYAHRPDENAVSSEIILPWERPNIPGFVDDVLMLILEIVKNRISKGVLTKRTGKGRTNAESTKS